MPQKNYQTKETCDIQPLRRSTRLCKVATKTDNPLIDSKGLLILNENTEENSLNEHSKSLASTNEHFDVEGSELDAIILEEKNTNERDPHEQQGKEDLDKQIKCEQTELNSNTTIRDHAVNGTETHSEPQENSSNANQNIFDENSDNSKSIPAEANQSNSKAKKIVTNDLKEKLSDTMYRTNVLCVEKLDDVCEKHIHNNGANNEKLMDSSILNSSSNENDGIRILATVSSSQNISLTYDESVEQKKDCDLQKNISDDNAELLAIHKPTTINNKPTENINIDQCDDVAIEDENKCNEVQKNSVNDKIDELLLNIDDLSNTESETEENSFIETMADEGEEDTPSEGSNDIIEVGEEINTTESELSLDESYENNSFIDDENYQLLSGEEYDLSLEHPKERRRIILISSESDDGIVHVKKPEKKVCKKRKKSRIIRFQDSSDEESINSVLQTDLQENLSICTLDACENQNTVEVENVQNGNKEPLNSMYQTDLQEKLTINLVDECEKQNTDQMINDGETCTSCTCTYNKKICENQNTDELENIHDCKICTPSDNSECPIPTTKGINDESSEVTRSLVDEGKNCNAEVEENGKVGLHLNVDESSELTRSPVDEGKNCNAEEENGQVGLNLIVEASDTDTCQIAASTKNGLVSVNENCNKKIIILENIRIQDFFNSNFPKFVNKVNDDTSSNSTNTENKSILKVIHNEPEQHGHEKETGHQSSEISLNNCEINGPLLEESKNCDSKCEKNKMYKKNFESNSVKTIKKKKKKRNTLFSLQLFENKKNISNVQNVGGYTTEKKHPNFKINRVNLRNQNVDDKDNIKKRKYSDPHSSTNESSVKKRKKSKRKDRLHEKTSAWKTNILDEAILQKQKNNCVFNTMSDEDWNSRNISIKIAKKSKISYNETNTTGVPRKKQDNKKIDIKNFRNFMLYDNTRVKRMDTQQLLRKKLH